MRKLLTIEGINQGNLYTPEVLTKDFHTTATMTIQLHLCAGKNDIKFYSLPSDLNKGDSVWTPDFDSITIYPLREGDLSRSYSCSDTGIVTYIGKKCGVYTFNASGKECKQVGSIGNDGKDYFIMRDIVLPVDGIYTLEITYATSELRTFRVGVNNTEMNTQNCTHDFWRVIYCREGSLLLTVNGIVKDISEGSIVFIPPNTTYSENTVMGFKGLSLELSQIDEFPEQFFIFQDTPQKIFYSLFQELYEISNAKTHNYKNILNTLVHLIIQYAIAKLEIFSSNKYVNDLANVIHDNIENINFRLSDYIEKIPMAANYFCVVFKQNIGMSPSEYLTYCRIQKAKRIFELYHNKSEIQIKQVALDCGFGDPYYFSRVFKKVLGVSPSQWIKECAEKSL